MVSQAAAPFSLAILQRVCTSYRLELFRRLAAHPELRVRVFLGDDLPDSKVRSTADFADLDVVKLPTRWFGLGRRVLPRHRGLASALRDFDPDVILSEGDSHFLAFLTAARVRSERPGRALVHWGLGGLPRPDGGRLVNRLKRPLQARADAFLVYSSFGRDTLEQIGHPPERIVVAVNVSDTDRHLAAAAALADTRAEARAALGLRDRFTVISIGAMDANKRIDVLIDAVADLDPARVGLLVVGGGVGLEALRSNVSRRGLENVVLVGAVPPADLARYYRAGDVLALPGRGGMVISEAMAHGLPVIVHQADGTETDLVRDGETGVRLGSGSAEDFRGAIERLAADPEGSARMGETGRRLVDQELNMGAMVDRILEVCRIALAERR
ncbi:MAG: glycosyltransferase family 4 protein [Myxococcota bacterium]